MINMERQDIKSALSYHILCVWKPITASITEMQNSVVNAL